MHKTKKELLKPKNDIVFQTLFSKLNKNVTKAFLSDILEIEITTLNLNVDKNLAKKYPEEKLGILDLRAELNDGIQCDIEIQLTQTEQIIERLLSYWARMYVEKLKRGDEYTKLKRTICILILDDKIEKFKKIEKSRTKWQIREENERSIILTKDLELHILELPKAIEEYDRNPKDKIMQWMKFINNPNDKEVENIMKQNQNIKEANDTLEELSQDEELRRVAFLKERARRDYVAGMQYATRKGLEQGIEQGLKQATQTVIKRLYEMKLSIIDIARAVDMEVEEVEKYISDNLT